MATAGIEIGQVLHGTYRVTRQIAEGGMGVVYEGEHLRLAHKKVAIKVLLPQVMQYPQVYQRFQREAEVVCSLGHPNIVYVIDFNELENGQPYMIMEYIAGEDLDERLAKVKRLPPVDVSEILSQAGSALQVVHDRDIVHRDLKPQNILLMDTADGKVHIKLLDFGISKIRDSKSVITRDQAVMGTPFYMSPEQAKGSVSDIDPRTDIFALAAIAYHCLTGRMPFDAPTIPGVLYSVCYEEPTPASELVDCLSSEIDMVLGRAMAKKRKDRYQRVEEFVSDMRELLARGEATQVEMSPFMLNAVLGDTDPDAPALSADKTLEQPAVRPPIEEVESEEATVPQIDLLEHIDAPAESVDLQVGDADDAVTPLYRPAVGGDVSAVTTTGPLPPAAQQGMSDQAVAGTIDEVSTEVIDDDLGGPTEDDRPTAKHESSAIRRQRTKTTLSTATGERQAVVPVRGAWRARVMGIAAGVSVLAAVLVGVYVLVVRDGATRFDPPPEPGIAASATGGEQVDGGAAADETLDGGAADGSVRVDVAAKPARVRITLKLSPKGARVTRDGKELLGNRLTLPKSDDKVVLKVSAPKHKPRTVRVTPNRDRTVEVTLIPKKRSATRPKKPRKPRSGRKKKPGTKKKPVRLFDDL